MNTHDNSARKFWLEACGHQYKAELIKNVYVFHLLELPQSGKPDGFYGSPFFPRRWMLHSRRSRRLIQTTR